MTNNMNQSTRGGVLPLEDLSAEELRRYMLQGLAVLTAEQTEDFISQVKQQGLLQPSEDRHRPIGQSNAQVPA